MTLYSNEAVLKVLNHYNELNGEIQTIQEGSLGYGPMVCYGNGLKNLRYSWSVFKRMGKRSYN